MDKVTIKVDSKWQRMVHSPLYYVLSTLQGVAITFAPLFLYWSGRSDMGQSFHGNEVWIVPLCFALIFFVPLFYFRLGGAVIKELRKS